MESLCQNSIICEYCKLTGHSKEKCFALHGYPEWHRFYGQPKPKPRFNNNKKVAAHVTAQTAIQNETTGYNGSEMIQQNKGDISSNLSEIQCQQLINMLQTKIKPQAPYASWLNNANQVAGNTSYHYSNSVFFASPVQFSNNAHTWILDSGATHHITPHLQFVDNPKSVNSELHLPNGDKSIVSHIGNIKLPSDIILKDVLVVPTFQCNLLSIPHKASNQYAL